VSATTPAPRPVGSAPRLSFAVEAAEALTPSAVPALRFAVRVESDAEAVRSVVLDVQLQIAARRRHYESAAHDRLFELFGVPRDWATTLRTLPWARLTVVVPPFTGSTLVDIAVPCSYDLDVAAARYFQALDDGEVPLEFLFGGTLFYAGPRGLLQTALIGWDQEAEFALPVRTWKDVMERHFAGTAWLRLSTERLDRLVAYRSRNKLASWDATVDSLLSEDR
jgi:hypothetical protein